MGKVYKGNTIQSKEYLHGEQVHDFSLFHANEELCSAINFRPKIIYAGIYGNDILYSQLLYGNLSCLAEILGLSGDKDAKIVR